MSISFFTNSPAPYRSEQMANLKEGLGEDIETYYTDQLGSDRKWTVEDVRSQYLSVTFHFKGYGNLCLNVLQYIKSRRLVVLGGYESPTYLWISVLCKWYGVPYFLLHDGIAPSRLLKTSTGLKQMLKKIIVNNASACWVNGRHSRDMFIRLGVKDEYIGHQYLVSNLGDSDGESLCDDFDGKKIILYSGRLIARKNVDVLIKAVEGLDDRWLLLIAGHGEMEDYLRSISDDKVVFLGHLEPEQLKTLYSIAVVTVLISDDEPWGLVVYEAIERNCPVLVGPDVGCANDLVVDGVNGIYVSDVSPGGVADGIRMTEFLDESSLKLKNTNVVNLWSMQSSLSEFQRLMRAANV